MDRVHTLLRTSGRKREVGVVRLGEEDGVMRYQGKTYPVTHCEGNGYVMTLITFDDR